MGTTTCFLALSTRLLSPCPATIRCITLSHRLKMLRKGSVLSYLSHPSSTVLAKASRDDLVLFQCQRQRFLTEDVFAGLQCFDGDLYVPVVRRHHTHDVDIVAIQHLAVIGGILYIFWGPFELVLVRKLYLDSSLLSAASSPYNGCLASVSCFDFSSNRWLLRRIEGSPFLTNDRVQSLELT